MQKGFLISFEGCEGAGKTLQSQRLRDALAKKGIESIVAREPGGTPISEQIRDVVLSTKNMGTAYTTEVLLFQAARAQLYHELVLPTLKAKKIVIMDRTRDSSTVYQGMVRGFGVEVIEQLNNISTSNTFPDITFLLDLPAEIGMQRVRAGGKPDRIESESSEFHQNVRDSYLKVAKANDHGRWVVIDGTKSIEVIADEIWALVAKKLEL